MLKELGSENLGELPDEDSPLCSFVVEDLWVSIAEVRNCIVEGVGSKDPNGVRTVYCTQIPAILVFACIFRVGFNFRTSHHVNIVSDRSIHSPLSNGTRRA